MKGDFISHGQMPIKVDSMNLDVAFRMMVDELISRFCQRLENLYPTGNYPISEYSTKDSFGVQITLEADIFSLEFFILRRNAFGYEIQLVSRGDCNGVFEFEFPEDDPLVKIISPSICLELNHAFEP